MTFDESVLLAILDKAVIAALILLTTYWLNTRLESLKAQLSLQATLAVPRAQALGTLWKHTQPLTPRGEKLPESADCQAAFKAIRDWYHLEAGGMWLSLNATDSCLALLTALEDQDLKAVKAKASALRTQLKQDIGSYSEKEAKTPLPRTGSR